MVHFAFLDSAGIEIASHDECVKASEYLSPLYVAKARNYVNHCHIDTSQIAKVIVTDFNFEMDITGDVIFDVAP